MRIEGSIALVTGAASGIGRRFAEALVASGGRVLAADIDEPGLQELAAALPRERIEILHMDVSQERSVGPMLAGLAERGIVADLLVNNAGILRDGKLASLDPGGFARKLPTAQWASVLATNLTGPFLLAREFVSARLEQQSGGGLIVNISSVSSTGNAGQSNYAAAKAGLDALTRTWSMELAGHGIRVAGLAPGVTDTAMAATLDPEVCARLIAGMPLGRMISTEEIWLGLRFIIDCDAFHGRTLVIDGGGEL